MIPCEYVNCSQSKNLLAADYIDHIQLHQLQNSELFNTINTYIQIQIQMIII